MNDYVKFKLLSIYAWKDVDGWYWNNMYTIEDDIVFGVEALTSRKILKSLRDWGFLSNESIGKLIVDHHEEMCDGYLIEILNKNTYEPILALSTIH